MLIFLWWYDVDTSFRSVPRNVMQRGGIVCGERRRGTGDGGQESCLGEQRRPHRFRRRMGGVSSTCRKRRRALSQHTTKISLEGFGADPVSGKERREQHKKKLRSDEILRSSQNRFEELNSGNDDKTNRHTKEVKGTHAMHQFHVSNSPSKICRGSFERVPAVRSSTSR